MARAPRRKKFLIVVGLLSGAAFGWYVFRPKPVLAVLDGPLPSGFVLYQADQLGVHAVIDWYVPLINKRIRIPNDPGIPVGFDPETTAGILRFEGSGMSTGLGTLKWKINGREFRFLKGALEDIDCPIVYGEKPVVAELSYNGSPPIKVRLPATGKPTPKASVHEIKLSKGTLKCIPEELVSPMFPIEYRLEYTGSEVVFLSFEAGARPHTWQVMPIRKAMTNRVLSVGGGRKGLRLTEVFRTHRTAKAKVTLSSVKTGDLAMLSSMNWTPNIELEALDGTFKASGLYYSRDGRSVVEMTKVEVGKVPSLAMMVQLQDTWFGCESTLATLWGSRHQSYPLPNVKNGQIIEVTVYEQPNNLVGISWPFPRELGQVP